MLFTGIYNSKIPFISTDGLVVIGPTGPGRPGFAFLKTRPARSETVFSDGPARDQN
jgi:hypothetical protein